MQATKSDFLIKLKFQVKKMFILIWRIWIMVLIMNLWSQK